MRTASNTGVSPGQPCTASEALRTGLSAAAKANEAELSAIEAACLSVAAHAALDEGDVAGALELSERALSIRDRLGGLEEDEAEVFVARIRALRAGQRPQEADAVHRRGRQRVEQLGERLADDRLRALFYEAVPAHRWLMGHSASSGL